MTLGFHPVQHLRRYRQIGSTFVRHGFGFAVRQLQPALRVRLGRPPVGGVPLPAEQLAEHFRLALEELGPTFVKLGQILSTRPDLLPPAYIAELSLLQDRVPPEPWDNIRAVLLAEYDQPLEEVFLSIDPEPIAAASLSQVHAAVLPDGSEVVVKVQRPGITQQINTDLQILAELAYGAAYTPLGRFYDFPAIVDQFSGTLRSELDYRREGRNADRFRENFHGDEYIYVPKVHWLYTTRHVLVLERIYGIKIDDVAAIEAADLSRKVIAQHSAQVIVKEVMEDGFFHADPHPGNFYIMPGNVIGALDFGMVGYVDERLRVDLMRLFAAAIEMDAAGVVDQLIRMEAVDEDVSRRGLQTDIGHFLNKYRGITLKELRAGEMISDILPIAFRHHLRLPTDLWLLAKTLNMLEGVGLRLDPEFDIFEISQPIVRRLMWRTLLPTGSWQQQLLRGAADWSDVFTLLPRATARILQQAERGELFSMHFKEADDMMEMMDRLVTRLSLSVLVAAVTVGLGVLIPASAGNQLARIVTILGFLVSATLSVWFAVTILRSYRRPRR